MCLPRLMAEEDRDLTAKDVREWRISAIRRGWTGFYALWPRDLFSRKYGDIIEFLNERRLVTLDPAEYYVILPYLSDDVESELLDQTFTRFRSSRLKSRLKRGKTCKSTGSRITTRDTRSSAHHTVRRTRDA